MDVGRWTNEDPIRFRAGDMNLYRYVTNLPTGFIDPSGMDKDDPPGPKGGNPPPPQPFMDGGEWQQGQWVGMGPNPHAPGPLLTPQQAGFLRTVVSAIVLVSLVSSPVGWVATVTLTLIWGDQLVAGVRTMVSGNFVHSGLNQGLYALTGNQTAANMGEDGVLFFASLAQMAGQAGRPACFGAGTPIRTPTGCKPIEQIKPGDAVLTRWEHDAHGPTQTSLAEEVFTDVAPLLNLHIGGRVIRVTAIHPFFVEGRGWVAAQLLQVGDLVHTLQGEPLPVEAVTDSGEVATVYNFRVAGFSTYFVGGDGWDFAVWTHNTCHGSGAAPHTPDQQALHQLASEAEHAGSLGRPISMEQGQILQQWADELGVPYRPGIGQFEHHPNRPIGSNAHIHIGNVDHIFVDPFQ